MRAKIARNVIKAVVLAVLPLAATGSAVWEVSTQAVQFIPKYVDELPRLTRIKVPSTPGQVQELKITLSQTTAQMHSTLPASPVFAYNGEVPGPVIEVESGQALRVHWMNQLPSTHIFAAPKGPMLMDPSMPPMPDVKSVTHLHGAMVEQANTTDKVHDNDGWPDLWTVTGEEQIADYPNTQDARLLWYHDHAMGDTGRNVAAGLAGAYIIRDQYERKLELPTGDYEIPLVIQAHGLDGNGARYYSPDLANEFYGNAATLNGKLWPVLHVEPRKYRFRIVNASNARTYALRLQDLKDEHVMGPAIYQIGTDSGFLQDTVMLNDPSLADPPRLTLAPAERADIIVDFKGYEGRELLLGNNSIDVGDGAEIPLPNLMKIVVDQKTKSVDTAALPMHPKPVTPIAESESVRTRRIVIDSKDMPDGRPMLTLNGLMWHDAVTESPVVNTTEIWEIVNLQPDTHPFHVHLVQFQVLDRTPFDVDLYRQTGYVKPLGPAVLPDPNERGWKDVVRVNPKYVTRIIMKFAPYTGHYVYHCHILEHEDMDMMRPFDVVPK